ncbi:MFS transporter [Galbitalea sp. SE-J8]|uniref:MFS transporter n=1 Tax=Galbitalea sp. SE-J8 TaxID=3054952 RepID=UPI00259CB63C|nr:MFS transporter [Galbitalea sp. SE-J8]MDM4762838.1 MFS transporter [Galbitalea sp. SE-J8]
MLAVAVAAQAAGTVFVSTPAFLIPLLHTERGLSLAEAGTLAAAPTFGLVLTLIAWGALVDRVGERWVIAGGLALVAVAALGAALAPGYGALGAFLLVGGAASGSTNAASGRLIVGWFPRRRRGLAMGIRQMSQPLGVTIAALAIPPLAGFSIAAAIALPLALTALLAAASAVVIRDPARPPRTDAATTPNPYRASGYLWRVHGVSALLVVPQFTLSTFGLVWMTVGLGLAGPLAGLIVGASQFVGAIGRILVGQLSDRVGSRVRPLRWVALAGIAAMGLLAGAAALAGSLGPPAIVAACALFVVATTISVADNGLAFTSVAEVAGPFWSGRALGAQNTGQFVAASVVGPAVGALIGVAGYPVAFVASAVCALVAVPLVPTRAAETERARH